VTSLLSIVVFFVLTYAVTWICWLPVIRAPHLTPALYALWMVGVFAPSLVAILLTAREGGARLRDLLARVVKADVPVRWYVLAIAYMAAVKLLVAVVYRLSLGSWPSFGSETPIVMLAATLLSTPAQFGEEVGWRGFALSRMAERMGFRWASVLLGVLWAGWHIPQFYLHGADTQGQSFPIWALEVTAISVALAWVYAHTGSVLLTMLMHSAINNTKDIVPSAAAGATNVWSLHASPVLYLTTAILWLGALYFLARMRRG
jgi:uncharacterized protein